MMQRTPRPTVSPLSADDELATRRALIEAFLTAWNSVESWATAEMLVDRLIDQLAASGVHLLKVDWR